MEGVGHVHLGSNRAERVGRSVRHGGDSPDAAGPRRCYIFPMRTLLRLRPLLLIPIALLAVALSLPRGSRAFADGEKPAAPPDAGAGMDGAGAGMEGDPKSDGDEDDGDTPVPIQEKVKKAVEKGVKYLKQAQLPNGSWGDITGGQAYGGGKGTMYLHPAGPTALALYTLLKCKEPLSDPYIQKGFKFLRDKQKKPGGAYEAAMMLLAITATADPFKKIKASVDQGEKVKFPGGDYQQWATALQGQLIGMRSKYRMLGWRYMHDDGVPPGGNEDLSCTQLCALALLASERCGIKTDSKVWTDIIKFTLKQQSEDGPEWDRAVYDKKTKSAPGASPAPGGSDSDKGRYAPPAGQKPPKDRCRGFAYIKSDKLSPDEGGPVGSMTACGICNLMMCRYVLARRQDDKLWAGIDQKGLQQAIYDGCAWLDSNWQTWGNPGKEKENIYLIYHMYCCERAFDLIDNNLLGKHSWYSDFAGELVARQNEKGFWNSNTTLKPQEVLDTCFALLVLKRSTKGGIPYGSITGGGDEPPEDNRGK